MSLASSVRNPVTSPPSPPSLSCCNFPFVLYELQLRVFVHHPNFRRFHAIAPRITQLPTNEVWRGIKRVPTLSAVIVLEHRLGEAWCPHYICSLQWVSESPPSSRTHEAFDGEVTGVSGRSNREILRAVKSAVSDTGIRRNHTEIWTRRWSSKTHQSCCAVVVRPLFSPHLFFSSYQMTALVVWSQQAQFRHDLGYSRIYY